MRKPQPCIMFMSAGVSATLEVYINFGELIDENYGAYMGREAGRKATDRRIVGLL